MAECGTTVSSLANAAALQTFDQTCLGAGTVNVPLFIDALSRAQCCSSRNCGGCVDEGQCAAVGDGDETGASLACAWAGEPRHSLGALVSKGRAATQSSLRSPNDVASNALDGDANGDWGGGSCTHTQSTDAGGEWWQVCRGPQTSYKPIENVGQSHLPQTTFSLLQVDLGRLLAVDHIDIYHRTDCCQERAVGARVIVSSTPNFSTGVACEVLDEAGGTPEQVQCQGVEGQYVTIDLTSRPKTPLTLCEVKVFAEAGSTFGGPGQTKCEATKHYYEFVDVGDFITWADARKAAAERGGYLATITSEGEQSCLTELEGPCGWLGGNDIDSEGAWEWNTGEPWRYENWSPGEPNDGTYSADVGPENFLAMNWPGFAPGSWVDHDGGAGGGVQNQRGYYVEYEDPGLAGCVGLDHMYPIYGVDGGGWTLVRRVAAGPTWHPATDQLSGAEPAYGTYSSNPEADATFGVPCDLRGSR